MKTLRSTIATFVIGTSLAAGAVVGLAPSAVQAAPSPADKVKVIPVDDTIKPTGGVKIDPAGGVKIDPTDTVTPADTKNKFPKLCDYAPELCPAKLPKDPKDPGKAPADPKTPGTTPKTPGTTPKTPVTTAKPSTNKDPKLPTASPDAPVKSTKVAFTG